MAAAFRSTVARHRGVDFAAVRARGRPCLLEGVEWPALSRTGWLDDWPAAEATLTRRGTRVALRAPARVARSGGAFAPSQAPRPLAEFAAAARTSVTPLVFSTAPHDQLSRALRHVLDSPPFMLCDVAAQPIVSLGGGGAGLAFHRHDESWLWLISGRKRWSFAPPDTLAATVQGLPLRSATESGADGQLAGPHANGLELLECEQLPSELVYVPAGWWHATSNAAASAEGAHSPISFGLGGLGRSPGLHFAAARGDATAIAAADVERALAPAAESMPCSLAHTAARHAQPAVLRALMALERRRHGVGRARGEGDGEGERGEWGEMAGRVEERAALASQLPLLAAPDAGSLGATPLHWASGASGWRARMAVRLLLAAAPATLHAVDRSGARPLHWVARSGDAAVARELLAAGADVSAADATGVRAIHLAAAEGHARLVRCLVREAGADALAPDGAGRTPLDWAEACGAADAAVRAALAGR